MGRLIWTLTENGQEFTDSIPYPSAEADEFLASIAGDPAYSYEIILGNGGSPMNGTTPGVTVRPIPGQPPVLITGPTDSSNQEDLEARAILQQAGIPVASISGGIAMLLARLGGGAGIRSLFARLGSGGFRAWLLRNGLLIGGGALLPIGPGGNRAPVTVTPVPGSPPVVVDIPSPRDIRQGTMIGGSLIVKTWTTDPSGGDDGHRFYLLQNGKIATFKKNGILKIWRPQKHIVVPRDPRIKTLLRADTRIDRLMRGIARKSSKLKLQK